MHVPHGHAVLTVRPGEQEAIVVIFRSINNVRNQVPVASGVIAPSFDKLFVTLDPLRSLSDSASLTSSPKCISAIVQNEGTGYGRDQFYAAALRVTNQDMTAFVELRGNNSRRDRTAVVMNQGALLVKRPEV